MKKPYSLINFFGILFSGMGAIFLFCGILLNLGVMLPDPNSQGDPAVAFPILGFVMLIFGVVGLIASSYKHKEQQGLLVDGYVIQGTVTKIERRNFIRFNSQSPYVVYFTYEYDGMEYIGKSNLLWSKPELLCGVAITVHIDESNAKRYIAEV